MIDRSRIGGNAITTAEAFDCNVVARTMYEDVTKDLRPDLPYIKAPIVGFYPVDAATGVPRAVVDGLY